ncbi:hypothetical protein [Spirillospora sp. NPDC047279]|uniref:hypothetical protein n=1 Tax=Spirillospora sp. NPDC047279 TaxID=3155478 RepID=UPI00340A671D
MAGDYTAYELRHINKSGDRVQDAALDWVASIRAMNSAFIATGTFGIVGDEAGIPLKYANVISSTITTLEEGVKNLRDSALALYKVSRTYEENEETIRRKIWMARGLSPESWALSGRYLKD